VEWAFDDFAEFQVADLRIGQFNDEALLSLPDLDHCHAIDLEGQPITDEGLKALLRRGKLSYIVLRKTNVTAEGVSSLQQSVPFAWIWH
jgi:hypothetical protein